MALISAGANKGNRFTTRTQEIGIVCQVLELLNIRVTSRSSLSVPSLGSPPDRGTAAPVEIVWIEAPRLLDSCSVSLLRELTWDYWTANGPTPAPPLKIISCQFSPLKVNCMLIPISWAPALGLTKVEYSYKLTVTYLDSQGTTAQVEIPSGQLSATCLVTKGPRSSCYADLKVFILNTQIISGNNLLPLPSSPVSLSPTAASLLSKVIEKQATALL